MTAAVCGASSNMQSQLQFVCAGLSEDHQEGVTGYRK